MIASQTPKMNQFNLFYQVLKQFGMQAFVFILAYTIPIHPFLITIYILLGFDLFTGISKAIRTNQAITSKRLRDSVIKFIYYSIAVFISYQVDLTLISDQLLVLTRIVGTYIIWIEFQSNIENISEITGVNLWIAIKDRVMAFFTSQLPKPPEPPKDEQP